MSEEIINEVNQDQQEQMPPQGGQEPPQDDAQAAEGDSGVTARSFLHLRMAHLR